MHDASGRKVIAGDFNAWTLKWGSEENIARGRNSLEFYDQLNILLANEGKVDSYRYFCQPCTGTDYVLANLACTSRTATGRQSLLQQAITFTL